ncbi:hypothetical protein DPMN_017141 [Dreissena polymorpha]|uniref:Uncharacterized protein n=1 Tax=Dreissena polymorpha TaxID=45954 RepID=A0A9D4NEB3_DREPO|nr:hypothetical protein DPMN_089523 [Dreissena polymorpha]KAH3893003.1 hypothetical protein DPMN_017141 [Dreissena polymorpha]
MQHLKCFKELIEGHVLVRLKEKALNGVLVDQATEWINRTCKTTGVIIGITRQDQARDMICITWLVRSYVSNRNMKLFNQHDDDEDIGIFKNRADGTRSRVSSEKECIKKMMQLFGSYDIFGIRILNIMNMKRRTDCSQ